MKLVLIVSFLWIISLELINGQPDSDKLNCTPAAIYEFPNDGFTRQERRDGWIVLHFVIVIYCFLVLSIVCDDYFVPAIQALVEDLKISEDVAGASFMAITSASPELFINVVGTFITQGDLGVGTVVGSNVFNILAVPACCALFTKASFKFEWWTIARDGIMYAFSVILLIITLHDDRVYWYEALVFVAAYIFYLMVMYYNKNIQSSMKGCSNDNTATANIEIQEVHRSDSRIRAPEEYYMESQEFHSNCIADTIPTVVTRDQDDLERLWNFIKFPADFFLCATVPDTRKHLNYYPASLFMCMIWIGCISYVLSWLITAIGDTIGIPDSIMGLSFLAIGSSMPEIVSCIIISKQGQGIMGMSSALGANTFEILLCLGLPWLIKTYFYPKKPGKYWIDINSSGLEHNTTCLFSTLIFLYLCLFCTKFEMNAKVGLICLIMYGVFLVVGTLIELNVFFPVNLPSCE